MLGGTSPVTKSKRYRGTESSDCETPFGEPTRKINGKVESAGT